MLHVGNVGTCGKSKGAEGLATGRGVSRTVAHGPFVPVVQPRRQRHGVVIGGAAVLETADFGFEFAAFVLFGLNGLLVIGSRVQGLGSPLTLSRRTPSARVSRIILLNSWRITITLVVSRMGGKALLRSPGAVSPGLFTPIQRTRSSLN